MPTAPAEPPAVPWRLDRIASSDRGLLGRSSLTLASRVFAKLAIAIFLVVAARLLSKEEFATYSYVLVLANTFGILADPQVALVAARDVATGRLDPATGYWSALPAVVLGGLLSAFGLLGFGLVDSAPGSTAVVLVLAGGFIMFNRLFELSAALLRSVGRFGFEAAVQGLGTLGLVAAATAIAATGLGVSTVLAAFCVHSLLSALVCQLALRGEVGRPRRPGPHWRPLLSTGIKLSVSAGATGIATRFPLVLLGNTASAASLAAFSVALRLADAAYLLALTAGQALLPSISSLVTDDPRRATRLIWRLIGVAVLVGTAIAALIVPFAPQLAGALFGSSYESSGHLLAVVALSLPLMGAFWISWFALVAMGGERAVLRVSVVAAMIALTAGGSVIPADGAVGASWVYVAVLATLASGTVLALRRRTRAP
ncbi:MAG: oligosaccharide flippase family protein [Solirubrobacteraceae bacterium]